MSGVINNIKAKVENVLHKDKDTTHTGTTGTHTTGTHTTGTHTTGTHSHNDPTGPHSSHAANQADPRVDSDHVGSYGNTAGASHNTHGTSGLTGTSHGTSGLTGSNHGTSGLTGSNTYGSDPTGPHDSHLGNKADPRVDSDHYGSTGNHGVSGHGSHGVTGSGLTGTGHTTHSDPTGPHDSRLGNKADPRVDSDRYGAAGNHGTNEYGSSGLTGSNTHSSGLTGSNTHGHSSGLTGSNTHGHSGTTGGLTGNATSYGSDPSGPHDSKFVNKLDPRVDSSVPGPHGNTGSAREGAYGSDNTGPHDSHLGNKADPRVDSTRAGGYGNTESVGGHGSAGIGGSGFSSGPGPAPDTAGPHKSNLLNKADPRVDSDLDGSKTYAGNKTYGN